MNEQEHLFHCIDEMKRLFVEINEIYDNISDVDLNFINVFATGYPFEKSFDEYPHALDVWADSMKDELDKESVEIEQNYCPDGDYTFIMKATYKNLELKSLECIGWYSGEPNSDPNYYKTFIGRNKATYEN